MGDLGFNGLEKESAAISIPPKKTRNQELTMIQKKESTCNYLPALTISQNGARLVPARGHF